jgi:hypothetical protein
LRRLAVGVALLLTATSASAQSGALWGYVRAKEAAAPLAEAVVEIPALQLTLRTNATGRYSFAGVPPGRYLVVARMIGFGPRGDSITVVAARETTRHFDLPKSVNTLDSAMILAPTSRYISPNLVGFEERRNGPGTGQFIAEEELRKHDGRAFADVLRRLSGMQIRRSASGTVAASSRRSSASGRAFSVGGGTSNCFATVYRDGIVLYDPNVSPGLPPRLEDIQVMELAGVEYYPGEASTPLMFRASPCGVLLLWTRER